MSADLHIHIMTDDMTEEDFKCFFSNHLGSKYFSLTDCEEEIAHKKIYKELVDDFHKKHPYKGKSILDAPKEIQDAWSKALSDYYKQTDYDTCSHRKHVNNSPNVWVGEVSWLKAALFEDADTYVPDFVSFISELIGEDLPIIDDIMINKVKDKCKSIKNQTLYSVSSGKDIIKFLKKHKGKKAFTVSW